MDRSFLKCLSGHLPFFRITHCCCRSPGQGMPSIIDIMQYVLCVGYLWLPLSTLHKGMPMTLSSSSSWHQGFKEKDFVCLALSME